jgi:Coenzyme PQQ synthesis protein D (PqqD)
VKQLSRSGLNENSILRIKETSLFRIQRSSVHILNMIGRHYFALDGLAAYLWLRLDGSQTLGEIISSTKMKFKIKDKRFTDLAMQFFADIFLTNLVAVTENRAKPMMRAQWIDTKSIDLNLTLIKLRSQRISASAGTGASTGGGGPSTGSTTSSFSTSAFSTASSLSSSSCSSSFSTGS